MTRFFHLVILVGLLCGVGTQSLACSRAVYLGPEDTVITVRSMDWASDIGTNLWVLPRGMERDGACGPNSPTWTSKYGSLIATAFDAATADGMNEKGLVANLLYLSESEYPTPTADDKRAPISISVWTQYVLDNFASVAEAVDALRAEPFYVVPVMTPDGHEGTVHLAISDPTGDSAIFEYIGGKLVIHHGREYQVMTNSPTYDQQLALNAYWQQIGGTVMLPGTNRAADRFVRASFYIKAIPQTSDEKLAVASAFSVIRNVSVPLGISTPNQPNISSTLWRSVSDHKNKRYYFESTRSPSVFWVNLADLDFAAGSPVKKLPIAGGEIYGDNTADKFQKAARFKFLPAKVEGQTIDKNDDSVKTQLQGVWLLQEINGASVPPGVKTPSLTIAADGSVSGFGGVNRIMGKLAAEGDKLFGPLAGTMMAGPPAAMKLEADLHRALGAVTSARQIDGRLELLGPNEEVLLVFKADK